MTGSAGYNVLGYEDSTSASRDLFNVNVNRELPLSRAVTGADIFDAVKLLASIATGETMGGTSGSLDLSDQAGGLVLGIPRPAKADATQGAVAGGQFGAFEIRAVGGAFITGSVDFINVLAPLIIPGALPLFSFSDSIGFFGQNIGVSLTLAKAELHVTGKLEQDFVFRPTAVGVVMTTSFGETVAGELGNNFHFHSPEGEGSFTVDAVYTAAGQMTRTDYLLWEEGIDITLLQAGAMFQGKLTFLGYDFKFGFDKTSEPVYSHSFDLASQKIRLGSSSYNYTLPSVTKHYTLTYENFYNGTSGKDNLTFTTHQTSVDGGAGDDSITGNTVNDSILGGDGNDVLRGGVGNDTLSGDAGNDTLLGNRGDDSLSGGAGDDSLVGGAGDLVGLDLSGYAFYAASGHLYKLVTSALSWDAAKTAAAGMTIGGLHGYLATITSAGEDAFLKTQITGASEIFVGATDAAKEGQWVWATGPEAGTIFYNAGAATQPGYSNWAPNEPNNANGPGAENYAVFAYNAGQWNDSPSVPHGYLTEFDVGALGAFDQVTLSNNGFAYNAGNGHAYKAVSNTVASWQAARDAAAGLKLTKGDLTRIPGYLATITSADEASFLKANFASVSQLYIGATDEGHEGQWVWATGPEAGTTFYNRGAASQPGYSDWIGDEPNNGNVPTENYAVIRYGSGVQWNDALAGTAHAYLVEFGGLNGEGTAAPGDDTLVGGDGNDTLAGGAANDSLDGGAGTDLLTYADNTATQGINLVATNATTLVGSDGLGGTDTATGFESILGGAGNDSINAALYTAPMMLQGGAGNDSLGGGSGRDTLQGGSGNDTLAGGGGNDSLDGGDGTDSFVAGTTAALSLTVINNVLTGNDGSNAADILASIEVILGGSFNDSINAEGLGTNFSLQGNDGNDSLAGGSGSDSLLGGAGSDTLAGHAGVDLLTGGIGADLFGLVYLNNALIPDWSTLGATDTIADFSSAEGDKLNLNNGLGAFTNADGSPGLLFWQGALSGTVASLSLGLALPGNGGSAAEGAFFQASSAGGGWLIVDTDLTGTLTAGDLVERLLGGAGFTLATTDFVAGTFSGASAKGTSGNDTLVGTSGPDYLDALGGADTLTGNAGSDTLLGGDGNDSLRGNDGNDLLFGGTGNDTVYGDAGSNTLDGGAGDDSLVGGGGTDTMVGGLGNDTMDGTLGNQLVSFADYTATQPLRLRAVDAVTLVSTDGLQPVSTAIRIDTLISIETIIGGAGNDTITGVNGLYGSSLTLYGGGGNDILIGSSAADTLVGGTGNDSLAGGKGNDSLDGGDGIDSYFGGPDTGLNMHAFSGDLVGEDGNLSTDTLRNIEVVAGNQYADLIDATGINTNMTLAGAGGNDTLTGSTGNDCLDGGDNNDLMDGAGGVNLMVGGAGDDIYIVNATTEVLIEALNAGLDKVRSSVSWMLGDNIERLELTGTAAIDGIGNALDNELLGNAGRNLLSGLASNDSLSGQDGNDTLLGGDGDDTLDGGGGSDSLEGGSGNDVLTGDSFAPNVFFNPDNGHFYQLITTAMDWATAQTNAASLTLNGLQGYLATVTSEAEWAFVHTINGEQLSWVGGSDAAVEGQWQWLTGPEAGTVFYSLGAASQPGFNAFASGNPNNAAGDLGTQNYVSLGYQNGWDDFFGWYPLGSVVEFGGMPGGGSGLGLSDTLSGGEGDDTMTGGFGDDLYIVDSANDLTIELANGGADTVQGSVSFTLGANIETMMLVGIADIDGSGNALDNMLVGNEAANRLYGGEGDDTLVGGDGNDTLDGGNGNDSLSGDAGADYLAGGLGNDTLVGGEGHDILLGGDGNDLAIFVASDAPGAERYEGGLGFDTAQFTGYDVFAGLDISGMTFISVEQLLLRGSFTLNLAQFTQLTTFANDGGYAYSLVAADAGAYDLASKQVDAQFAGFTASTGDDTVLAADSGSLVDGGDGNDVLVGGNGADSLMGDTGDDSIAGNAGDDVLGGGDGIDTLLGGDGNDALAGGAGSDHLFGEAGDDTLAGSDDNDILVGGTGSNSILGGAGDDVAVFSEADSLTSNSSFDGGDGYDTANFQGIASYGFDLSGLLLTSVEQLDIKGLVTLTAAQFAQVQDLVWFTQDGLGNNLAPPGSAFGLVASAAGTFDLTGKNFTDVVSAGTFAVLSGGDTVAGFAGFIGSVGDDVILGANWAVSLSGAGGNDSLVGGAAADTLDGGVGDDSLAGGDGNDVLTGGLGSDSLVGGAGDNQLVGDNNIDTSGYAFNAENGHLYTLVTTQLDWNAALTAAASMTIGGLHGYLATVTSAGEQAFLASHFANGFIGATDEGHEGQWVWASGPEAGLTFYNAGAATQPGYSAWNEGEPNNANGTENYAIFGAGAGGAWNDSGNGIWTYLVEFGGLPGEGGDTLVGGDGKDTLDGGVGNDSLDGGTGNDSLLGGIGDDTLVGAAGEQTMAGGAGNDSLIAGSGNDALDGGDGNDGLAGGTGDDTLAGGTGDDTLAGGYGADSLDGGVGNDLLSGDSAAPNVVFNPANGHFYQLVTEVQDWTTAQTHAASLSLDGLQGYLATVTSAAEQEFVRSLIGDTWFWIGASDAATEGQWQWVTGPEAGVVFFNLGAVTQPGFAAWSATFGEPNNFEGDQNYAFLWGQFGWGDNSGDPQSYSLVEFGGMPGDGGSNWQNDTLSGGDGNDTLDGGYGNDLLSGDAGNDSLVGGLGDDSLNGGSGNDTMDGGAGNDTFDGGVGADVLVGGLGSDSYLVDSSADQIVEAAGGGADTILTTLNTLSLALLSNVENLSFIGTGNFNGIGNAAANAMLGGTGKDTLAGAAGDDTLDGGAGADSLDGGTGNDTYVIDNTGDKVVEAAGSGTDTVLTSLVSYSLVTLTAVENLGYTGTANFDGTGNNLANGITGGVGNDTLVGGGGNDTLAGGAGADSLTGGLNDDTYVVDNLGDVVVERLNQGTDTVQTSLASFSLALLTAVENLAFIGTGGFAGTGNALGNGLAGGAGNDTLDGGVGADTMAGGLGDDSYVVDNIGDVVSENAGEGTDTVLTSLASFSLVALTALENVTYSGAIAFIGTGNALANGLTGGRGSDALAGGVGNDTLVGAAGNDTLDGGSGADSMVGGVGNDSYVVDNIGDIVVENAVEGTDAVSTSLTRFSLATLTAVENLSFTGTASFTGTGNALANAIASARGNDTLDGGTGADSLTGGLGNDTYLVDNAGDVVAENVGEGTDSIRTTLASYSLATLTALENLAYTGTGAFAGTGNALANIVTGGAGNDTLDGAVGADTMVGGLGNDTYLVDNAGDVVTESADEGTDLVRTSLATYSLASTAAAENLSFTGSAAFTGTGNALANMLTGGAGNDSLDGGGGADTMAGGLGDDSYVVDNAGDIIVENAGAGIDTVGTALTSFSLASFGAVENLTYSGASAFSGGGNDLANAISGNRGADALTGGAGDDTLAGGFGDDTLDGGSGADSLTGGVGNDTYVVDNIGDVVLENAIEGTDTVMTSLASFSLATLGAVDNLIYLGANAFAGAGNALSNVITGGTGNDTLDGAAGFDTTAGGLGDDTYVVNSQSDLIVENAGEGTDTVLTNLTSYNLTTLLAVENLTYTGSAGFAGIGNGLANLIISGAGNDSMRGGDGDDTLDGGVGVDSMAGGLGNDSYFVDNIGDRISELTASGTDTVLTTLASYSLATFGTLENLSYLGTAGFIGIGNALANAVTGGTGADTLTGAAGEDTLDGGAGADSLVGGAGNDAYVIDNLGDMVVEVAGEGTDTVRTTLASFGIAAFGAVENLAYAGSGTFSGIGNALANVLTGGAGNDTLDGATGNDTMIGGAGDDSYVVDSLGDVMLETAAGGTDTVRTSLASYSLAMLTTIENLTNAGSNDFTGIGNVLANAITGSTGNDTLVGDEGDDTLDGGGGADSMAGGIGDDTYVVDTLVDVVVENLIEGTDTVRTTLATFSLAPFHAIENLTYGGSGSFVGLGNVLANVITGGAANDTLDGGGGGDTLAGGDGGDTYIVNDVSIMVVEAAGQGTDTIRTSMSLYLMDSQANVENLTYTGTGSFISFGNALANVITAGAGGSALDGGAGDDTLVGGSGGDTLTGGDGADSLDGGLGNDTYIVDSAIDLIAEAAGGGTDTVLTGLASYSLAAFAAVEALVYTGVAAFAGTGNAAANTITGGAGKDTLFGGDGSDTLDGGAGSDSLSGGFGDDTYVVDSLTDLVLENAGEGTDTVLTNLASYSLATIGTLENLRFAGAGSFAGTGNTGANAITGGVGDDTLDGGTGADTLTGGVGDDSYLVDNAGDVVVENAAEGFDKVWTSLASFSLVSLGAVENLSYTGTSAFTGSGNALANVIAGGAGADVLEGGAGADTLVGGLGNDTFAFAAGQANGDAIVDFDGKGSLVGDKLLFKGYGTAASGAKLTQVNATDWQVSSADHTINELIHLASGTTVHVTDYAFA